MALFRQKATSTGLVCLLLLLCGVRGLINEKKCPNFGPMESFREEGLIKGRVSEANYILVICAYFSSHNNS